MTHTYVTMSVSDATFNEIKQKLEEAAYHHAIDNDFGRILLDMHGIALYNEDEQ